MPPWSGQHPGFVHSTGRLSFSARRPRPCGLGMTGAPARRVGDCLPTVGPAEIYACGAEPIPKAPTNVSDGHGRVPLSGAPCSAQESPCLQAWGVVNNLLASIF